MADSNWTVFLSVWFIVKQNWPNKNWFTFLHSCKDLMNILEFNRHFRFNYYLKLVFRISSPLKLCKFWIKFTIIVSFWTSDNVRKMLTLTFSLNSVITKPKTGLRKCLFFHNFMNGPKSLLVIIACYGYLVIFRPLKILQTDRQADTKTTDE